MSDSKATLKMTPEVLEALTELCEENELNNIVGKLECAEDNLQEAGYEDWNDGHLYLFRVAYDLKLIRQEFEKLIELFGYERYRE